MAQRKDPAQIVGVRLTTEQRAELQRLANGGSLSDGVRAALAKASPKFAAAPAPRPKRHTHVISSDELGRTALLTVEQAETAYARRMVARSAALGRRPDPQDAQIAARLSGPVIATAEQIAAAAAEGYATTPNPVWITPGLAPAAAVAAPKVVSEREDLDRLRAEAYAKLSDIEKADADKLTGAHRARFIVARLRRKASK
jgi:hypothetical protein